MDPNPYESPPDEIVAAELVDKPSVLRSFIRWSIGLTLWTAALCLFVGSVGIGVTEVILFAGVPWLLSITIHALRAVNRRTG